MAEEKELNSEQEAALREIARPSLLKQRIPSKVLNRLIELGYVEETAAGPVATPKGKLYLLPPQRKV